MCCELNTKWSPDAFLKSLNAALGHVEKNALPIVLGPEFLFAQYDSGKRSFGPLGGQDAKLSFLADLLELSANALVVPGTQVAFEGAKRCNYAPVYFKKALVQKVYKATKGGTAEYEWDHEAIGGGASAHPDSFVLDYHESSETRFGVEICNDIGQMKQFLKSKSLSVWPEVYLMPSYGMATEDIYYLGPNKKGYMTVDAKAQVQWKNQKYTVNLDPEANEHRPSNVTEFALHSIKPGMFIQSDGFRCRVGYKYPMSLKFTLIPPLKSYPVQGAGNTPLGEHNAAVHVFPAVDLNPLKPFWV
ncbi:hypothetical protein STIAU_7850 [Stigmatella aurantiaca DW4/3-1]|nr:hypothetical protein STIAU_7850 [Stigmatella aurantiaca DW4/3-1]